MPPVSRKSVGAAAQPLAFILLIRPTLTATPPEGDQWLHEVKHDGYRTELIIDNGSARAFTMNGHDWTDRYSGLVAAAAKLQCKSAILDGEAVVQREDGLTDFHALRGALSKELHRIVFFAFDLLHLNGTDLRKQPLVDRRRKLEKLLGARKPNSPLQLSEAIEGSGAEIFKAADQLGLEGIVSKRKESRYESGASQAWLKTKCTVENEFVVVGVEPNPGGPPFALLAREEGGKLVYAGSAFVTLPTKPRDLFWKRAEALTMCGCIRPFACPRDGIRRGILGVLHILLFGVDECPDFIGTPFPPGFRGLRSISDPLWRRGFSSSVSTLRPRADQRRPWRYIARA